MGLDICVYKILKEPIDKNKYFVLIDENGDYNNDGFPEWTKPLENTIQEERYDWDKYRDETGMDIDDYHLNLVKKDDKDGVYMEFYRQDDDLPKWKGGEGWKDYEEYKAEYKKHIKRVYLAEIPSKRVDVRVLYKKEVGYQRKGLNKKFYEDYENGTIGYFVWTKAELERYMDEYCDDDYDYTYGNITEHREPKKEFKENIIDKFTEGEDCVIFSW
jgi:hypothetical protein